MTTALKTARGLFSSSPVAAGGTAVGAGQSLQTALGALVTLVVTNGSTGPTMGCEAIVEISRDGLTWYEFSRQRAGTVASSTYTFHVDVPVSVSHVRPTFSGNTGQAVTAEAFLHELTSIG